MTIIKVEHVSKRYGNSLPLRDVCLEIQSGETVALLAPSGSGKTTLLRCLANLEQPSSGAIHFQGRLGLVLQHLHLFPHMHVLDNISYTPIKALKQPPAEARELAMQILDKMGLHHKSDAYPSQLSGGQKQRVAIARALAIKPDLLLLDEPTSALDHTRTHEVWNTICDFLPTQACSVVVTHNTQLAHRISQRVLMLQNGVLQPVSTS